MSLFKITDIPKTKEEDPETDNSAASIDITAPFTFLNGSKLKFLRENIGILSKDKNIFFKTDGAWSAIDIVEFMLQQSGPADVYFSTWSIGPDSIRYFTDWLQSGKIRSIHAIIDIGFRNRKPDLYAQAVQAFPSLKFSKSHAKVAIIKSDTHQLTLMGSANFTRNPRIETGVVIWDDKLAAENISWIMEEINS